MDTDLIGLTIEEAERKSCRIVRAKIVDGEYVTVNLDYSPYRINVEVKNEKIIRILGGFN